MPETNRVRFGIIGCGGAAVPVAEAMAASTVAELARVHDRQAALAQDLGERFRVPVAGTLEELLADPTLAAIYVAVPHNQLAPIATRVLEAGKHVLVEKPMSTSVAEADALIALANARGLALGVFYELRHTAAHRRARALLQAGAIGTVVGVHIQTQIDKPLTYWQVGTGRRTRSAWRGIKAEAGGGVVLMNTSHALDTARWLTGLEVVRVSGEIGTLVAGVEVEDTATASLRYDNGALGSLFVGAHLAGANRAEHTDIFGTEGQLRLPYPYGPDPLRVFLRRTWEGLAANEWHTLAEGQAPFYARAVDDFAQSVQSNHPASAGSGPADSARGWDARQVLAIVMGLYQASAEQTAISLHAIGQS